MTSCKDLVKKLLMKKYTLTTFFLLPLLCYSQNSFIESYYSMKRKFIIENQTLIGDPNNGFYHVLNNEASLSYGLVKFLAIGVYHDYYYASTKLYDGSTFNAVNNLFGLRGTISAMPLLSLIKNADFLKRADLNLNGYFSYSTGTITIKVTDKKDHQHWPVYFRVGGKYYFTRHLYATGSVGVYNTDRFFLGIGLKL